MVEEDFRVDYEDTALFITPELARQVKRRLIGFCCNEGIVDSVKVDQVFERLGLDKGYSVQRFVKEGMNLGREKILEVLEVENVESSSSIQYRIRVVDLDSARERAGYGVH